MNQLAATNEIAGAILGAYLQKSEIPELEKDAKAFIYQRANIDLDTITVGIAENNDETVHIALPYYSALSDFKVQKLQEADMNDVAGGEVLYTVIAVICCVAIVGSAAGGGLTAAVAGVAAGTSDK